MRRAMTSGRALSRTSTVSGAFCTISVSMPRAIAEPLWLLPP